MDKYKIHKYKNRLFNKFKEETENLERIIKMGKKLYEKIDFSTLFLSKNKLYLLILLKTMYKIINT